MPTWLLLSLIVLWAVVQYGLTVWALRDLLRREPPPGASRLPWAFVILTLPIVGALAYATHGPGELPFRLPGRLQPPGTLRMPERLPPAVQDVIARARRLARPPGDPDAEER